MSNQVVVFINSAQPQLLSDVLVDPSMYAANNESTGTTHIVERIDDDYGTFVGFVYSYEEYEGMVAEGLINELA